MGWNQYVRAIGAEQRREQREAARTYRALDRLRKQQEKVATLEHAQNTAARYENYVALLTSVHVDCGPRWDWEVVSRTAPPPQPHKVTYQQEMAQQALAQFNPGFFGRLFGGAKQREQLETALAQARVFEEQAHQAALAEHAYRVRQWEEHVRLSPGVLRLDLAACRAALAYLAVFAEIEAFRSTISLDSIANGVATLTCTMHDPELVPTEEVKLTSSGKLSSKPMAVSKYWLLLQDHVCSCAISIARETFTILPVGRVIVNMMRRQLDSSTGHIVSICVLAVHFTPEGLARLHFDSLDPSDSMANFHHRMKFKKASGFEPIELSNHEENWVTT